jgi:hypothetical protein
MSIPMLIMYVLAVTSYVPIVRSISRELEDR